MGFFTFIFVLLGIIFIPRITLGVVLIKIGGTAFVALGTIAIIWGCIVGLINAGKQK